LNLPDAPEEDEEEVEVRVGEGVEMGGFGVMIPCQSLSSLKDGKVEGREDMMLEEESTKRAQMSKNHKRRFCELSGNLTTDGPMTNDETLLVLQVGGK
jgi:hypothetical protein